MFNSAINAISTKTSIGVLASVAFFAPPGIVQKVAGVGAIIGILGRIYNAYNTKAQTSAAAAPSKKPSTTAPAPVNAKPAPVTLPVSTTPAAKPAPKPISPSLVSSTAPILPAKPTALVSPALNFDSNAQKINVGHKIVLYSAANDPRFSEATYHKIEPTIAAYNAAASNPKRNLFMSATADEAIDFYNTISTHKRVARYDEIAIVLDAHERDKVVSVIMSSKSQ